MITKKPEATPLQPVPLLAVADCKTVYDYFLTMLGMPNPPNRIGELREDYPLTSPVGIDCISVIDAATKLIMHMRASYGAGCDAEAVRQFALHACEVYAFG